MGKSILFALALITTLGGPVLAAQGEPFPDMAQRALRGLLVDVTTAGDRLVAVGARGHILFSDDQGQTWRLADSPSQALLTAVFFVDAQHGWAVGHDAQILATNDGGSHWTLQRQAPEREAPLLDVWFANTERGLAVGAYGEMLATDDGGHHWEEVGARLDNPDQLHLNAIGTSADGTLFIVGEQGGLFRSSDQGLNWERLDSPYQGSLFGLLATQAPGSLLVYGLRGNLLRSSDNGDSWHAVPLEVDSGLAGGATMADGALVIVGNGGTVLYSHDDGATFTSRVRADRQALAAVVQVRGESLWLVGQGGAREAVLSELKGDAP